MPIDVVFGKGFAEGTKYEEKMKDGDETQREENNAEMEGKGVRQSATRRVKSGQWLCTDG